MVITPQFDSTTGIFRVFDVTVKMSYVVAMCRRGVLNSKPKQFLPFGRSPIWTV